MNMNGFHKLTTRGFTLIETMVAITILTIAIAGPMFTANRAIVAAQISRDQLIASYLAQEGIEYVRAMRDDKYLEAYPNTNNAWNDFLNAVNDCIGLTNNMCTLDPSENELKKCSGSCNSLYLSDSGYTQTQNGTKTQFTRSIQITDVTDKDKRIVSTALWSFHGIQYSVTVSDHLTPWQ